MKYDINLFSALQVQSKKHMDSASKLYIIIFSVSVIITLGLIIGSLAINRMLKNEINSLNNTLNDPQVKEVLYKEKEIVFNILNVQKDILTIAELEKEIKSQKGFELWMYDLINGVKPDNVTISSISYADMTINLSCISARIDGDPPADYAKALEKTGKFSSVSYNGFSENGEDNTVTFPITCVIKGE